MSHLSTSKVVISSTGLELNQQLEDHFKKSIEQISAAKASGGATGGIGCGGGSQTGPGTSWRDKLLPRSFFEPSASTGNQGRSVNHSRDNSTDSSGRFTQSPPVSVSGQPTTTIAHGRAHSSPATLTPAQLSLPLGTGTKRITAGGHVGQGCSPVGTRTISAAAAAAGLPPSASAPNATVTTHQRFLSYDSASSVISNNNNNNDNNSNNLLAVDFDDLGMLPDGWEKAYNAETGQHFYYNYVENRVTSEDPRKCMSASHLHHQSAHVYVQNAPPQNVGPLPPNWEEAYTADGHKYFINHNEQRTTWFDPRLPEKDQCPTIMQQRHIQYQMMSNTAGQNKFAGNVQVAHHASSSAPSPSLGSGRNSAPRAPVNAGTFSPNSQKRVHDLNQERRNYRLRQEEIMKQGLLMDSISPNPVSPNSVTNIDSCISPYGMSLNGGPQQQPQMTAADLFHMRQESGDSGVGMMTPFGGGGGMRVGGGGGGMRVGGGGGGQYSSSGSSSQAHTPENFLLGQPMSQQQPNTVTLAAELPAALNIAGIDLNYGDNLPMEMDPSDDIPQLNPNDLDQILNCRPPLRH